MIVVSDTSPITNLIKIGRVDLLHDLYDIVIVPPSVLSEASFLEENRRVLNDIDWIYVVQLQDKSIADSLLEKELDSGETEAIALSLELDADVLLIDETEGRRVAVERGVFVVGLVGVLLEAKNAGLIKLVKPELEKLSRDANFWMSPRLVAQALETAGED